MLPFAFEYPPEQLDGFWGPPSSTIDWCEENYVVSTYIAEALNTVTNSVFIALALFATYSAYKNKLELRFILSTLGFCLVGIGSWLFHMTLQYRFQLLDELPMIYATCIPFWSVFSEFRTPRESVFVGIGIFLAANTLTCVYLYFKDPTIHQVSYAILNAGIIFQSINLTQKHVKDDKARKELYSVMITGVWTFLLGYFLWNLDIHFCSTVRSTRRSWGMPYGFVLEGHGWWHILTGTGVYYYIIYEEYLRCFLNKTNRFYKFSYVFGFLPFVECIDKVGLTKYEAIQELARHDREALAKDKKDI
ncbi:alkaline ceramidase Ypc1p [[Candida] railenensis]|uniref:Alkaline ceramidase Ypc1p n=1 Tax=[Candida] railenensis TaxID=45579 RepID=A0A9P0QLQ8_9ASCO|nr:alkaline ceramidase Ypc1p [[Candida] railenensis]